MRVVGLLIAGVPLLFAAARATTTGTDFRFVWLALVSTATAAGMLSLARRGSPPSQSLVVHAAFAILAAAGTAGITAFALGAGSAPAVFTVALGFASCSGVGLSMVLAPRAG
jgi:hypothetical protein